MARKPNKTLQKRYLFISHISRSNKAIDFKFYIEKVVYEK